MTKNIFNLANNLSFIRIILALVAAYLIMAENLLYLMIAIILIAYSELTDMLDGYIARRDNTITDLGKLLDPLSDSISRFFYFFAFGYVGLFPIWLILALFLRDIIVAYIRTYVSLRGIAMGARWSGKAKAIVQFAGQYILLFIMVIILRNQNENLDYNTLITLIIFGSVITIMILYFLKIKGKYLKYSIVGYLSFLVPFYFANIINISPSVDLTIYSSFIMILVSLFTLYSLYDYILAFIQQLLKELK